MHFSGDNQQLTIQPPRSYYFVAYGFVITFGAAGLVYAAGILFVPMWPQNVGLLEKAVYAGLPILFIATLAWWALGDVHPFRLDRVRGLFFDGAAPRFPLNAISAVTVRPDEGDTCTFYAIGLTLADGRAIALRRNLWPMDTDPASARAKAQTLAQFLGVALDAHS